MRRAVIVGLLCCLTGRLHADSFALTSVTPELRAQQKCVLRLLPGTTRKKAIQAIKASERVTMTDAANTDPTVDARIAGHRNFSHLSPTELDALLFLFICQAVDDVNKDLKLLAQEIHGCKRRK